MASILKDEEIRLINDPESVKVLATVDREGVPHAVFKGSLHVNEAGQLEYYDLIESSQTNKNMVTAIWFHKTVTAVIKKGNESIQVKGIPQRAVISGREFEKVYTELRKDGRDIDLSTIWRIEPTEVRRQTFEYRKETEEKAHPILKHLDRLVNDNV